MESNERYQKLEKIGAGQAARVYAALDLKLGRKVALKELRPELTEDSVLLQRLHREARAVASLSHPNIVSLYDYIESLPPVLVMEYIEGNDLQFYLDAGLKWPSLALIEFLYHVTLGLKEAHGKGIIHRDLKPSNIVIDKSGLVKITDFGIATLREGANVTQTLDFIGTPQYMSPEWLEGKEIDSSCDIFSLGCICFYLAEGRAPFTGNTPQQVIHSITSESYPPLTNTDLLPEISALIQSMFHKSPKQRPKIEEILSAVQDIFRRFNQEIFKSRLEELIINPEIYVEKEMLELKQYFDSHQDFFKSSLNKVQFVKYQHIFLTKGKTQFENPKESHRRKTYFKWLLIFIFTFGIIAALEFIFLPKANKNVIVHREPLILPSANAVDSNPPQPFPLEEKPAAEQTPARAELPLSSPGFLRIKSRPPFAKVFWKDSLLGTTPLTKAISLPSGQHQLVFEKEGCRKKVQSIQLKPKKTLEIAVELEIISNP